MCVSRQNLGYTLLHQPVYEMLRITGITKSCLHLTYDMWDTAIEKVKMAIYRIEKKGESEDSSFCGIQFVCGWAKINTPLHFLAHSLNLRYL